MADEELWGVRNAFHLGCFQQAIAEAMNVSEDSRVLANFYTYRAYVEMGQYRMVLDDVGPNAPTTLQAAKALAAYHAGGREDKDMAVESLKEWLASSQDQQLLLVAALVFSAEGDYKEALKWVHQSTDLETMAVVAHIYLSMNRVELARKQVGLMQQQDDDATLTKLSGAWVSMAEGGDKYQDALYEFQELGEKYNMSLMLTNGMALANMHMGKYDEAERLLQEGLGKSASDVNTLSNMVVTMHYLRKPQEVINRYANQLKTLAPTHPYIAKYSELESAFDRCAAQASA